MRAALHRSWGSSSRSYTCGSTLHARPRLESAMYRMLVIASFSAITATACSTAQVSQVQPIDGVISGQCHTDMVRGTVGLAAAPGTVERARVDSDSLQVNVVRGSAATAVGATPASSGGERLTIEVGRTNNITALRCG